MSPRKTETVRERERERKREREREREHERDCGHARKFTRLQLYLSIYP